MRRLGEQRAKTALTVGVEVERENEAFAESRAQLLPIFSEAQAFRADDQGRAERQPEGAIGDIGEAGVDPQIGLRQRARKITAELKMVADTFDGVEVGDVKRRGAAHGDKSASDGDGVVVLDTRTLPRKPTDGEAMWGEPLGPHTLENVGSLPLRIISTEIKHGF